MAIIRAPFTKEQVDSLNGFQRSGIVHPFTCGTEECRADLVATKDGWICDYCHLHKQDWAHDFMADGSWKQSLSWQNQLDEQIERSKEKYKPSLWTRFFRWLLFLCPHCGSDIPHFGMRCCENCKMIDRFDKKYNPNVFERIRRRFAGDCKACGVEVPNAGTIKLCDDCFDEFHVAKNGIFKMKTFKGVVRWIFRRCQDCNAKLPKGFNRGDVCKKCFDDFNGATIKEIMS